MLNLRQHAHLGCHNLENQHCQNHICLKILFDLKVCVNCFQSFAVESKINAVVEKLQLVVSRVILHDAQCRTVTPCCLWSDVAHVSETFHWNTN